MGDRLCLGVDLTAVKAGGEIGGHKIAVLNYLNGLRALDRFRFVLVGTAAGRADLVPLLAPGDSYLETWFPVAGSPVRLREYDGRTKTKIWRPKFLQSLGVQVLYSPFGTIHYSEQGLPFVTWIADLLHRDCPITLSPRQIRAREDGLAVAVRESLFVQTNTHFIARHLQQAYAISPDRLIVLPPIPQDLHRPEHLTAGEEPYFFYPANFWAHKNHRALLSAYQVYLHNHPASAWSLVMTGHPGVEQDRLKRFAEELGLTGKARFLGYLDRTDYVRWFAGAGCLLFPSLYEGFGMPLIEAMRLRVPIAAAAVACIPEICGEAILKFDPTDIHAMAGAMRSISVEESLRYALIAAGEERQKKFDSAALIAQLADLLSRAAQSGNRSLPVSRSLASNLLRLKLLLERYLVLALKKAPRKSRTKI